MIFLGEEWLSAMDAAARSLRVEAALVVEQVVEGVPGRGEVRYHIVFAPGGASVRPGPAARADVRMTMGYAAAAALARGETNAQALLARGRLRLGGDLGSLAAHAGALAAVPDAFAQVRADTVYPDAEDTEGGGGPGNPGDPGN